ncbi:hypothetical protein Gotur_031084 [Gossypium turneri]
MCERLEHNRYLDACICRSVEHHRHLGGSNVPEPLTPLATLVLGCARASSTIGTLELGCAGASSTKAKVGPLLVREHRLWWVEGLWCCVAVLFGCFCFSFLGFGFRDLLWRVFVNVQLIKRGFLIGTIDDRTDIDCAGFSDPLGLFRIVSFLGFVGFCFSGGFGGSFVRFSSVLESWGGVLVVGRWALFVGGLFSFDAVVSWVQFPFHPPLAALVFAQVLWVCCVLLGGGDWVFPQVLSRSLSRWAEGLRRWCPSSLLVSSPSQGVGLLGHSFLNEILVLELPCSWDILRRVGESVREEWVVGGDFNAILNDAEKEGGRRGVRTQMNDFKEVMDEIALVDIKPDSGWFTWVNNRNEGSLIKERLDRFLTSVAVVENFPFIATKVFDVCWAGDEEAKNVIERAWNREGTNYGEKMERVRSALGPWQGQKFGKMKSEMRKLEKQIECWDANRVEQVYGRDWGDKICNIPIGDVGQADRMIWFHNPHGYFTSKSAYSWLLLKEIGYGPHRFFWKAIWKLDTLPKIRVFTWRVGHEILPTNCKIATIRQGFDKGCPRCGAETETLLHALKDCPTSRDVLSIGGWSRSFISKNYDRCIDWLEDLMRVLDKRAMADLMTILWNCWNNRNNFIFRGKEEEAKQIWERASNLHREFRICNLLKEPLLSQNIVEKKWKRPPKNFLKVNFDATVGENRCGYGTVIRDEEGFVLGGGGFKEGRMSVEEAECMAFEESIKVACNLNLKDQVIFETDHVGLVNKFNNLAHDVTTIGARIKDYTAAFSFFKSANLIWTERSSNTVAHLICKKMCSEAKHCLFKMDYPPEIHSTVICDVS